MKKVLITSILIFLFVDASSQCNVSAFIFSSDVNFYNAKANWAKSNNAHHYKIRYKEIPSGSWLFKNNISNLDSTKVLANLTPQNTYIWQIRTYCDSTNTLFSQWSAIDTFFTSNLNCPKPVNLFTSNITHYNALAHWSSSSIVNRYSLRYRILGTTNWYNLANIAGNDSSTTVPLLAQSTNYEWQLMAYYDSTIFMSSLWSDVDTFATLAFVPASFNPNIHSSISSNLCNTLVDLRVEINQQANEPDIGETKVTTDGGSFLLNIMSPGDTIGSAKITTPTRTVTSDLIVSFVLGNFALINSYDSTGGLIGFFNIENTIDGIEINTTSPNDGNNYTSGMNSEVVFYSLFKTPNFTGTLNITADIVSELQDQIIYTNPISISCINNLEIEANYNEGYLVKTINLIGSFSKRKKNIPLIKIYKNGSVVKQIIID